jgi:hypothetical protein
MNQITTFYNSLNPDGTVGAGNAVQQLETLNAELAALEAQLIALDVTPRGIVQNASRINRLMGETIPVNMHAMVNRLISIIDKYPDPANVPVGVARMLRPQLFFGGVPAGNGEMPATPSSFYGQAQPAFFGLAGLMSGMSIQMNLVNRIYGPIMQDVTRMMVLLAANGLLAQYTNTANIFQIITGGSLSFHAPNLPGSSIEGLGFSSNVAANDVFFVGPNAVSAVEDLLSAFNPGNIDSMQDVFDFFDGIIDALQGAGEAYDEAHKLPSSFVNFCVFDDPCTSLIYNSGFPDVNDSFIPSPVIVIVNNMDNGSWSSGIFNFVAR